MKTSAIAIPLVTLMLMGSVSAWAGFTNNLMQQIRSEIEATPKANPDVGRNEKKPEKQKQRSSAGPAPSQAAAPEDGLTPQGWPKKSGKPVKIGNYGDYAKMRLGLEFCGAKRRPLSHQCLNHVRKQGYFNEVSCGCVSKARLPERFKERPDAKGNYQATACRSIYFDYLDGMETKCGPCNQALIEKVAANRADAFTRQGHTGNCQLARP